MRNILVVVWVFIIQTTYSQNVNLSQYYPTNTSIVIDHGDFAISFDTVRKLPDWSIHILYHTNSVKCNRKNFTYDKKIDKKYQRGYSFYKNLNADSMLYDRGHLVPFGDFTWDNNYANKTMIYTNTVPQYYRFNRGLWRKLENHFARYARNNMVFLIVITGVIYKDNKNIPDKFYKIYHSPLYQKSIAFLIDNGNNNNNNIFNYSMSIDDLETITRLNYFSDTLVIENEFSLDDWK